MPKKLQERKAAVKRLQTNTFISLLKQRQIAQLQAAKFPRHKLCQSFADERGLLKLANFIIHSYLSVCVSELNPQEETTQESPLTFLWWVFVYVKAEYGTKAWSRVIKIHLDSRKVFRTASLSLSAGDDGNK